MNSYLLQAATTPVPRDLPLDLPLPEWLLVTLLIVSFLLHIIFVKLMVGGSILTLWAEIKGLKNKEYDTFAYEVAKTVTVNKSMAVVLGVAPLLSINTLYTVYFYSANALTGLAWFMIIPLVTIAFLLTYLHKYTWLALANYKYLHISIIALAVLIFLIIPTIFLTNVNLMLFPERWAYVKGFLSALMLPNVLPRYVEFIGACLTVTGIFIVWYNGRISYPVERIYLNMDRSGLKRLGYYITMVGLGLQLVFGLIVMLSLPSKGINFEVIELMVCGGVALLIALWFSWKALSAESESVADAQFWKIATSILIFILIYGGSRQMYREQALDKHRQLMHAKTAAFEKLSKEAREHPIDDNALLAVDSSLGDLAKGAALFKQNCASCHKEKQRLVGPPVSEMATIYSSNERGLKAWIKAPGKKRADFPQMPGFPQLSEEDLSEIAKYILSVK
ncbi:cytochrome c [uncultured Sphingobacterium sp.]|uniref:c-type cytochrome n=1 Tax=uncultured Sphingobacterium sp. TaxID=182688 RepID=UPI0025EAC57E|nr:cytochrome c [uncultured Sphingobacterium sp.]